MKRKSSSIQNVEMSIRKVFPTQQGSQKKRRKRELSVMLFPFSSHTLLTFRRWIPKSKDCVVNALELIGWISSSFADVLRIVVGDQGISEPHILQILQYLSPTSLQYHFGEVNYRELMDLCLTQLPVGYALFCNYVDDTNHVFLLSKIREKEVLYIDPQISRVCSIQDSQCSIYFSNKRRYHVLLFESLSK